MGKKILYQEVARKALEKGMHVLAEAVAITLGPKGRNVVFEKKYGNPQIVNDGVTIAKEIELADPMQNTGVSLIRQAAAKTNDVAGDGTTTATILAYGLVKEGMRTIAAGANPVAVKIGMEKAAAFVIDYINEYARPIEQVSLINNVATISAGNDPIIGSMLAEAFETIGKDGLISIEEGNSISTVLEIKKGMKIDRGFISPYFITNTERMLVEYENPFVLLTDKKITVVKQELVPILEQVAKTKRPLLIIADGIEREALATLILNNLRGLVNVVAIRTPGFGNTKNAILEDIGILTQGVVISEELGFRLENTTLDQLGTCRKLIVSKDDTTIITNSETDQQSIQKRCDQLKNEILTNDSQYEKDKLKDRLAKLSGGVVLIKVGAITETEMQEKKLRLEDAVNATRAAIEEGIVPGGGSLLAHISQSVKTWSRTSLKEDETVGGLILSNALIQPLKRIAENAGKTGDIIIEKVQNLETEFGYDAENDNFGNMLDLGIIDPSKVTRSAVRNAVSIAGMILTTECLIVKKEKKLK